MFRDCLVLFFSLGLVACASNADFDPPSENVEERTEATTCGIQLSAYPVKGPHNNGYDSTAGDSSQWSCQDAHSNSDFVAGDHLGNDIWAAEGTPVVATVDGTLTLVGFSSYSGNKVTIIDGCGWYHFYCHLQSIASGIGNGGSVKAGTVIGYVGKTGTASNGVVHLHYSIYPDGNYDAGVNPWQYLHAVEQNVCGCSPQPEQCNGVDDDCNGTVDDGDVCIADQLLVPQMGVIDGPVSSDVDGDGLADVCARSSFGFGCQRATEGGFDTSIPGPELSNGNGWADAKYYGTLRMGDIDGDGKTDLCARGAAGIGCWPSEGDAFGEQIQGQPLSDEGGWGETKYWSTIRLADVNGDGKADMCARAAAGFACWLSDGNGFPTAITGPELSDANGWGEPRYYSTIRMADPNGDGKIDVCARSGAGFSCWLSEGSSITAEIAGTELSDANGWGDAQYYSTLRMADLNGDGKSDVCARGAAGLYCWLSQGSQFSDSILLEDLANDAGWGQKEYYTTIRLADIDGNGMADVCGRDAAGIACWPFEGDDFGARVAGPEWSDASGWGAPEYYSTLHLAGGCSEARDCGSSTGGSGGGGGSGGWGTGGGSFGGNGDGVSGKPGSESDSSCALTPIGGNARTHWLFVTCFGLALFFFVRRR
jgi:hypothetical protein